MSRYRVSILCSDLPVSTGRLAAGCIENAFKSHRPWHQQVCCDWDGLNLNLTVENDFDANGLATSDEFSDEITACVSGGFDGNLAVISVELLAE